MISHLAEPLGPPAALLTDGLVSVPLWAVSRLAVNERFALPPIGVSAFRAAVGGPSTSITLNALLVGSGRFAYKELLELLAGLSRRSSMIGTITGGASGGLVLVSRLTTRTDLHVTSLDLSVSAQRRDTIEVSLAMQHVPRPGPGAFLLDVATAAVATMVDPLGGGS